MKPLRTLCLCAAMIATPLFASPAHAYESAGSHSLKSTKPNVFKVPAEESRILMVHGFWLGDPHYRIKMPLSQHVQVSLAQKSDKNPLYHQIKSFAQQSGEAQFKFMSPAYDKLYLCIENKSKADLLLTVANDFMTDGATISDEAQLNFRYKFVEAAPIELPRTESVSSFVTALGADSEREVSDLSEWAVSDFDDDDDDCDFIEEVYPSPQAARQALPDVTPTPENSPVREVVDRTKDLFTTLLTDAEWDRWEEKAVEYERWGVLAEKVQDYL